MGVCNCSMLYCTLLYIPSSFAIILMGKRELVALLSLSSWYLVIVVWLFLVVPWICLQFVIVVFPDHTHLRFSYLFAAEWRVCWLVLCVLIKTLWNLCNNMKGLILRRIKFTTNCTDGYTVVLLNHRPMVSLHFELSP